MNLEIFGLQLLHLIHFLSYSVIFPNDEIGDYALE